MEVIPNPPKLVTISKEDFLLENYGSYSKPTEPCDYLEGGLASRELWKLFQTHRNLTCFLENYGSIPKTTCALYNFEGGDSVSRTMEASSKPETCSDNPEGGLTSRIHRSYSKATETVNISKEDLLLHHGKIFPNPSNPDYL
ncbi:hypothetical protein NPIL_457611 [Nephila pilipes]|uniref:Uncharacterized protein n=1 Tax=Nephila pilipes TaxID=299642 RepID=A0A8X6QMZ6_NEPPI|nr:hypothetical protein NPIL_457611 [Nephila pilipes]